MVVLFEPHQDDCALFAAFTAIRERALVVTVLRSVKQEAFGIPGWRRELENETAMRILGLDWVQWDFPDVSVPWDDIGERMRGLDRETDVDRVYAPAVEAGGHDHHNRLGALAGDVFPGRSTGYLTYTIDGKSTSGPRVEPAPFMVTRKLRALACYRSQIETPAAGCMPHFTRGLDEHLAA